MDSSQHKICLEFQTVTIVVSSPAYHLLRPIETAFAHFVAQEEPLANPIKLSIRVSDEEGHGVLAVYQAGKCVLKATDEIIFFQDLRECIFRIVIRSFCSSAWLLHASAVSTAENCAAIFPGSSGTGKTTLIMRLVQEGFRYLSDDVVPIDSKSGQARSFPTAANLREPARGLYFPDDVLRGFSRTFLTLSSCVGEGKSAGDDAPPPTTIVDVAEGLVIPVTMPVPVKWVMFLRRTNDDISVKTVSSGEAFKRLLLNCFNSRTAARECLEALASVANGADAYEIRGRDLEGLARCIGGIMLKKQEAIA